MMKIENSKVIAAIIDCLDLPVSKACDVAYLDDRHNEITFVYDEWDHPEIYCRCHIWTNFNIKWWGAEFYVMHPHDIGHWEIDCKTGNYRRVCCYNSKGKIQYGRYYEPSMD